MSELKSDTTRADVEACLVGALKKAGIKTAPRYQTRSFARSFREITVGALYVWNEETIERFIRVNFMSIYLVELVHIERWFSRETFVPVIHLKAWEPIGWWDPSKARVDKRDCDLEPDG